MANIRKHSDSYVGKEDVFSIEHIRAMLNTVPNQRDRLLIKLMLKTGCTVSELVCIRVEDVSADSVSLAGKSRRRKRKVELSSGFAEELDRYIKSKRSEKTSSTYLFSSRQSKKLNPRRVQQIVKDSLGISPGDLRKIWLAEASKKNSQEELERISGLKRLQKKRYLSKKEIEKVRRKISEKSHLLIFDVLLETGCTVSELVNLQAEDISGSEITIGRISRLPERTVGVSENLSSRLKGHISYKAKKDFLFSTRQSPQITDKRVFQILKRYGGSAGIDLNPRLIRNTRVAWMKSIGRSDDEICRELGISHLGMHSYGILSKDE